MIKGKVPTPSSKHHSSYHTIAGNQQIADNQVSSCEEQNNFAAQNLISDAERRHEDAERRRILLSLSQDGELEICPRRLRRFIVPRQNCTLAM